MVQFEDQFEVPSMEVKEPQIYLNLISFNLNFITTQMMILKTSRPTNGVLEHQK
jgi:hypothetical protein